MNIKCFPGSNSPVAAKSITTDDMVLSLHSEKDNWAKLRDRAKATFGEKSKQQSVIRCRSDLYISDVFRGHKFFPSPTVYPDKRKPKTKAVELLPNAITSKEWKAYVASRREEQKGGKKRKVEGNKNDEECPPPKRRPGRPRKNSANVCDTSITIINSYTARVGTSKPIEEVEIISPCQRENDLAGTANPAVCTPVNVKGKTRLFSSAVKIIINSQKDCALVKHLLRRISGER